MRSSKYHFFLNLWYDLAPGGLEPGTSHTQSEDYHYATESDGWSTFI